MKLYGASSCDSAARANLNPLPESIRDATADVGFLGIEWARLRLSLNGDGERHRKRVCQVRARESAGLHVFLLLKLDLRSAGVAVLHAAEVYFELRIIGDLSACLQPLQ